MTFFDLPQFINSAGYIGIALLVFSESGVVIGFFFPGDTLLFTAGILAGQGAFSVTMLATLVAISAYCGSAFGYWSGKKLGPMLFTRDDTFWLNKKRLLSAQTFFEKYGKASILLARFVPIARTFVPIVAGAAHMNGSTFAFYNALGAVLWGGGITLLGYFIGHAIPQLGEMLLPISSVVIVLVMLLSLAFALSAYWKEKRAKS